MTLLTVGPADRSEDEHRIGDHHRGISKALLWQAWPLPVIAYFTDVKWVAAYGFAALLYSLLTIEARGHDAAIRLRRITALLDRNE